MANVLFRRLQEKGDAELTPEEALAKDLGSAEDFEENLQTAKETLVDPAVALAEYPQQIVGAALTDKDVKEVIKKPISKDRPQTTSEEILEKNPKFKSFLSGVSQGLIGTPAPPKVLQDLAVTTLTDPLVVGPAIVSGASKLIKGAKGTQLFKNLAPKVAEAELAKEAQITKTGTKFEPIEKTQLGSSETAEDLANLSKNERALENARLDAIDQLRIQQARDIQLSPRELRQQAEMEASAKGPYRGLVPDRKPYTPPKKPLIDYMENKPSYTKSGGVAGLTEDADALNVAKRPTYHGTTADITKYEPKDRGAVFSSFKPEVANEYTNIPEEGGKVYKNAVSPDKVFNPADPKKLDMLSNELLKQGHNPEEVKSLIEDLGASTRDPSNWKTLESPSILKALKGAGFDSSYIREAGNRNLMILNPDIMEQALTKSQRSEALKNIKARKLEPKAAKIVEAQKAYEAEMMKKIK